MIDYIKGKLVEKNPAYAVVEANGIGYIIHISLHTYSNIPDNELCKLLTYYSVNVDVRSGSSTHSLYGLAKKEERETQIRVEAERSKAAYFEKKYKNNTFHQKL